MNEVHLALTLGALALCSFVSGFALGWHMGDIHGYGDARREFTAQLRAERD